MECGALVPLSRCRVLPPTVHFVVRVETGKAAASRRTPNYLPVQRLKIKAALVPPNPNELDST